MKYAIFIALVLLVSGCAQQQTVPADQQVVEGNAVNIQDFAFNPPALKIKAGDTVTWTNADSVRHTVTSDSGKELDSQLLENGESYSHTFNAAGTFDYHCTPHPGMKGTIIVE